ncbi:MAG: hypothetical protein P4L67_05140 [Candidatus Pacebacteria bacterium]|nr:hypothetical protein [Candidatus Paceibacterota bacterium]
MSKAKPETRSSEPIKEIKSEMQVRREVYEAAKRDIIQVVVELATEHELFPIEIVAILGEIGAKFSVEELNRQYEEFYEPADADAR